ncbi:hypothetical protein D9758_014821 [Tetrapyrgos nigripes]|uniref:Uncharacterized protein n=1 Tax=Tetrapyrgos nigripes TaxID=182062 RepID=A0A8H5C360_9AGAR|nr:hypothetical protein D9758_014821 [Tetrapyrgos nigripes]
MPYAESVSTLSSSTSNKSGHSIGSLFPHPRLTRSADPKSSNSQTQPLGKSSPSRLEKFKASLKPPARRSQIPAECLYMH